MTKSTLRPGIALGLSGGGFRATLFHIGTLIRLNELGYLAKLDRISAVSGDSITAGMLACRWDALKAGGFAAADLERLVTLPLRAFCARNIDARAIAEGTISPWSSISDVLTREYDDLFEHTRLPALPDIHARSSTPPICRPGAISAFPGNTWPIIASARSTIPISAWQGRRRLERVSAGAVTLHYRGRSRELEERRRRRPVQQSERLRQSRPGAIDTYQTVLVSDAGAPFGMQDRAKADPLGQLARALDIATDQARGLRSRYLIELAALRGQKTAYWGIDTRYDKYPAANKIPCDPAKTDGLKDIRTRLDAFDQTEQESLINWGYALCDAAMRSFIEPGVLSRSSLGLSGALPRHSWSGMLRPVRCEGKRADTTGEHSSLALI